ncbi:MAG: tetratricopeptide repeat protein [Planctomycetota bacterium]|jgi:tetratricopeptide (TPR) repeat protein
MEKEILFKTEAVRAEPPSSIDHVIMLTRAPDVFERLVRGNLELGRDNMLFASLEKGEALLRIDNPSFYLLRKWREDIRREKLVHFYAAGAENLYVEWGLALPVSPRAIKVEGDMLYMLGSGGWLEWKAPQWRDIYETVGVSLADAESGRLKSQKDLPRIEIQLRLTETSHRAEPDLWQIPENEVWRLEKLLNVMPESDLKNVQVTLQQNSKGTKSFFVRELIAGKTRKYLKFPGTAYAPFAGYSGFMLPVGMTFEPAIRADRYRDVFDIRENEIAVIVPGDGAVSEDGKIKFGIIRFDAASFRPLPGLVDYICALNAEKLENVVRATVFDFSPYNYTGPAISWKEPSPVPETEPEPKPPPVSTPPPERGTETAGTVPQTPEEKRGDDVRGETGSVPEPLQLEEKRLEEIVSLEPDRSEEWLALADVKLRLGAHDEAVRCFEEGIWHENNPENERELLSGLLAFIKSFPAIEQSGAERKKLAEDLNTRATILETVMKEYSPDAYGDGAHGETIRILRESNLPKKARWLLWREICRLTGDDIGAETARENIRSELNRVGLLEKDSFGFVSKHLLSRFGISSAGRSTDMISMLGMIRNALLHIQELDYRAVVRSFIAKGFMELGETDKCRKEMRKALEEAEQAIEEYSVAARGDGEWPAERTRKARAVVLANAAGILGRLRDDGAGAAFERAAEEASSLKTSIAASKEETMRRLLENIAFTKSRSDYTEIIEHFWRFFDRLQRDRKYIFLRDCSGVICEVEENLTGREKALELLNAESHHSLYIRMHGIEALVAFSEDRPLDDEIAKKLLQIAVDRRREIDGSSVFYVEGLLRLAPEAGIALLRSRIAEPNPAAKPDAHALLVNSCIARSLSAAGKTDQAHNLIIKTVVSAKNLDKHRLPGVISHCVKSITTIGRKEKSAEILHNLAEEIARELEITAAAPVLGTIVEGLGLLDEPKSAISRMEQIAERLISELEKKPRLFWFVREALVACIKGSKPWTADSEDMESALRLILHIKERMAEILSRRTGDSMPMAFFRGSVLLSVGESLSEMGRDAEAAEALAEALRFMPAMRQMDRDELAFSLVEAAAGMETRHQIRTLHKLIRAFPALVGKGLGSPKLKDSVLPRCIEVAMLGEPVFKSKMREREGLVELAIRRRLRNDEI